MKTLPVILVAGTLLFLRQSIVAQGSLTPPGPPAPTMKSLDQVASTGIAINSTNTPGDSTSLFIISQSGSYYLTGNITGVSPKTGIRIAASHVTVDLNGFYLNGASDTEPGILVPAGGSDIEIRNGTLSNWLNYGVSASNGTRVRVIDVRVEDSLNGIAVGANSEVRHCVVQGCAFELGADCVIRDSIAEGSAGFGIVTGDGALIEGCVASQHDNDGIHAASHTLIEHCVARSNQGNGILIGDSSLINDCVVNFNGKKTSPNNTAADGIKMGARNRVVNCTVFSNAQHGIESTSTNNRNYIEGCLLHSNAGFAIFLQAGGNTVIKNQVGGNTGGTINVTGLNIAPIQDASTAAGTMHPLANFP